MIAYHTYLIVGCLLSNSYAFAMKKDPSNPRTIEETSTDNKNSQSNRDGKIFSLFSIVQFKNQGCRSSQTLSNTVGTVARNGTCYSGTECTSKSGTAAGSCAAGFGVCCVFVFEASGGTISQNCSYIRNLNYPSALTDTTASSFTIAKCDASVCFIRLDFESFDTNGLSDSIENTAVTTSTATGCQDTFTITSTNDPNLPEICGKNQGQHVYVDLGASSADTATLAFAFSGTYDRYYEIKVTQLPCTSEYARFAGCFQYFEGLTGKVESFNFPNCGSQSHLPNHAYSICVRPQAGYDCVNWQVCDYSTCSITALTTATEVGGTVTLPSVVGANSGAAACTGFSLGQVGAIAVLNVAGVDTECTNDYISINGGSFPCCQGTATPKSVQRNCGHFLHLDSIMDSNIPICDCVAPYEIEMYTDKLADNGANFDNVANSCGICLQYNQVKC